MPTQCATAHTTHRNRNANAMPHTTDTRHHTWQSPSRVRHQRPKTLWKTPLPSTPPRVHPDPMALTAKQRNALPRSAFAIPSRRAYPIPTKTQARKAGISEAQRIRLGRNALARSTSTNTGGNYATMGKLTRARMGNAITTTGRAKGNTSTPGLRGHRR